MRAFGIFLAGLTFGLGLAVSGMTSPDKVIGFLDVTGAWDPSLAFVMGGAVLTAMPLFALARRRARPFAGARFDTPPTAPVDGRLLGGAALFGIGWGLTGICPGPAIVDLAAAPLATIGFVAALLAGIAFSARVLRPFLDATGPAAAANANRDYASVPAE